MATPNLSMEASDIDKSLKIGTLTTAEITDADYIPFYSVGAAQEPKQRKISVGSLISFIKTIIKSLPDATEADAGKTVAVNELGEFVLGAAISETKETHTVNSSAWYALTSTAPFNWYAEFTVNRAIGTNTIVELINNDPLSFANYGLCIGSRNGNVLRLWAIKKPSESLLMVVRLRG